MRILHVVPTYLPALRYGGPIYSVHGLARALARRHDVQVFTTNVDGPSVSPVELAEPVDLDGVKVWYFPCGWGRRVYRSPEMGRALAACISKFDLLHLHSVFLWPTMAAARVAQRSGVPYVLSPRGMLVGDLIRLKSRLPKNAWISVFERRTIRKAAAVHATSDLERCEIERLGFSVRRFVILPNGVDPPNLTTNHCGEPSRTIVLSLGRVSWKKGLDRLILAMAFVPHADLIIAGEDEEGLKPRLQEIARGSGVEGRIRFVGPVHSEAKWALMRSASVFVLPSYSENFGNSVLEAMASGIPVVVTPQVGLASAVKQTGAGLVVSGDPRSLGTAIAALISDRERRRTMGEAGRNAAETCFSWDAIARQMELVYAGILKSKAEFAPISTSAN